MFEESEEKPELWDMNKKQYEIRFGGNYANVNKNKEYNKMTDSSGQQKYFGGGCCFRGRPSQERHTANSYSIWRTRNQDSRPYLDENKLANVRRDIFRNNRLTDSEISAIKHATENDINIRHKGNEESDEQYSPPRGLIERLPSDQSTQRPEDTRNSIVPVKDSQENEKTTVTEDLKFAEEHRESMAEMRQKILNTLEVVRHTRNVIKS
ncbi:Hypothetical predicted protein [Octopus vulgaris]|uniref:Uncharacterized protein n=1 Tax=Octopus vulgaris TaxID=6645 RepID=A0AA36F0H4_OCTVU|nr:Hypothetical predicted protein [Octopus vulgaris]